MAVPGFGDGPYAFLDFAALSNCMSVVMSFNHVMFMTVFGFVFSVDMGMTVNMLMFMRMHHITMTVFMGMYMAMLVGVL